MTDIQSLLDDAWERWLLTGAYAQKQRTNLRFAKKFCKFVAIMWNKADADAQFLQNFFVGGESVATDYASLKEAIAGSSRNLDMLRWQGLTLDHVSDILSESDLKLHVDLQEFLYDEYKRVLGDLAMPLHARDLARNALPEQRFADLEGQVDDLLVKVKSYIVSPVTQIGEKKYE